MKQGIIIMEQLHLSKLWWVLPNKLLGMPQPQENDISALHDAGIKAIVSLLEDETSTDKYQENSFNSKWLPVADNKAPTIQQVEDLVTFVDKQLALNYPVAIHCKGGKGRTGTLLAAYLIAKGATYEEAMNQINKAQTNAVKKPFQIDFLKALSLV